MVSAESLFFYLYDMYAAKKNMDFHFTYDEGLIRCDASLIKSVLINLLDNACKASEPGGPVEVYGYALSEGYRFSVKDHGVGIPEEELHKITKAFYMVDKSRSRSRNGSRSGAGPLRGDPASASQQAGNRERAGERVLLQFCHTVGRRRFCRQAQ